MKAAGRFPELALLRQPGAPRGRLEDVLDRLAVTGYRVNREKWKRFESARLVFEPMPTERGERDAIRRLRRILDIERRLAPTGDIDALCFHLAAAGIEEVPAALVARHIVASVGAFFIIGDRLRPSVPAHAGRIGPDAEFQIGRAMAKHALAEYRLRDRAERRLIESLTSAAFVGYVRSTFASERPAQLLHSSSRLVTCDTPDEKRPAKRATNSLPPLSDRAGLLAWLSASTAEDESAVLRATQSVAALIRLHVHQYPELQAPWRDVAASNGAAATTALQTLALVPPVLVAAFLQAGHAPPDSNLDRMLEQLMHFWGTVSYEAIRFDLATGAFPWVQRDGHHYGNGARAK